MIYDCEDSGFDYADFEEFARQIYDFGMRAKNRDYIKEFYELTDNETNYVCEWLETLESEEE